MSDIKGLLASTQHKHNTQPSPSGETSGAQSLMMSPDEPRAPSRWEPSLLLSLAGARCRQLVVTVVAGPGGEPLVLVVTVWQRAHRTASPVRGEPREPSRLCCPQTRTAGASVGRLQSATLRESGGHHSASHRLNAVTEMLRQALALR